MKLKINKLPQFLLVGVAVLAMATAGAAMASVAADQETEAAKPSGAKPESLEDDSRPALQAGQVVHVDPATGKKVKLPSQAQRAAARAHLGSMINRSDAGLFETASPVSGVMVNLQGRFRHANVLTLDRTGEPTSQCTASLPATEGEEEADHE